ncbi:MAG: PD40 domain-containing protein [Acidobacteria bacterium]|nr:PD40 domain-containing protein [Acidobacteriota bacterium]
MKRNTQWIAITTSIALAALSAVPFFAQQTKAQSAKDEVAFRAAMEKETVQGDLKGAIEQYKKIAQSKDRSIAARALVRMADSYQKLGDTEAQKVYERIVRDYADQKEAASMARARLGRTESAVTSTSMASRQVWTLPPGGSVRGSGISADGRLMTYIDWATGGDLAVHDFATGRDRRLSNRTNDFDYMDTAAISRDGKQVAYTWYTANANRNELRVASLEGAGLPQSRLLFANEDVLWFQPFDWSPDGNWIAVQLTRQDRTGQLGLISARDGTLRVLKSSDWRGANQLFFSPDGKYLGFDVPVGETANAPRDVFILAVDGSREIPAVVSSNNDTMMGWSPDGKHLLFASDRSGTVSLWAVPIADGRPQGSPELIKPDIPRRSIGVSPSGSLYMGVPLNDQDIHVATVDLETGKLVGKPVKPIQSFVGFNDNPDWSPDGKEMAYISRRPGVARVLGIRSVETGQVREIQPKLNYVQHPRWAPDGRSFIVTGRDLKDRPGVYRVDAQTGEATTSIGSGQYPQLSPDGKKLYSLHGYSVVERDLASGSEREVIRRDPLFAPMLSPDGRFLAATSLDETTKSSVLLLISVSGGEPRELIRVSQPQSLLLRCIAWTPDSQTVIVGNSLSDNDVGRGFLLVPAAGGPPRQIDVGATVRGNLGLKVHPDGRQIAFVAGDNKEEVWVLENFLPAVNAKR